MRKISIFIFCFIILCNIFIYDISAEITENIISIDAPLDNPSLEMQEEYLGMILSGPVTFDRNLSICDNDLTSYFYNLTYNHGVNYKGSCGYVALGMLLSYYDTYWNDDIVPEQYDVVSLGYGFDMLARKNSPGIQRDLIANPSGLSDGDYFKHMSTNEYFNKISSLQNTSLHAKLITIGESLGFYNYYDIDLQPTGTNFHTRLVLLHYYLQNFIGLDPSSYSISCKVRELIPTSYSSTEVRNFTIEKVQSGIPVLLSIRKTVVDADGNEKHYGHVVVAYDYDEETDELFCHFGYGAASTHWTPESDDYDIYKSALIIEFNDSHTHSDNYAVREPDGNIVFYCFDDECIKTVHTHSYDYTYGSIDNYTHTASCECGLYEVENHNLSENVCIDCNRVHSHYFTYQSVSSLYHVQKCRCGATGTQSSHRWGATETDLIGEYAICLDCGHLKRLGGDTPFIPVIRPDKIDPEEEETE